jgi:hypothetical protein
MGTDEAPKVANEVNDSPARISRRQVMSRVSAGVAVGATAWIVPEILTASPAAGASLSGGGIGHTGGSGGSGGSGSGSTGSGSGASGPGTSGTTDAPGTSVKTEASTTAPLAMTGFNAIRDLEIGAALIAGGWALNRWASRMPQPATEGGAADATPPASGGTDASS